MTALADNATQAQLPDVLVRAREQVLEQGIGLSEADVLAVLQLPDESVVDLLAFLGALALAGGLALLADHAGQLSARLAFAGAAVLAAGCTASWRRLRRRD